VPAPRVPLEPGLQCGGRLPYDTASLDDAVLDEACRSHRHLALDGLSSASPVFRGLEEIAAIRGAAARAAHGPLLVQVFQAPTLAALRQNVVRHALDAGFDRSASEKLALGVTEVATNSVVHGGGGGLMRVWEEDATLICEVSDTGRIDQPLAGRERPQDGQIGGFGLWLANHVCDLVRCAAFRAAQRCGSTSAGRHEA
jgi:anti-sigma regulatory factor (Ser/Thr protein kinase)